MAIQRGLPADFCGLDRDQGKEMLVLSRKVGERILIGEKISVTVVRIAGGAVRLGVEAPPELAVIRQELKDQLDNADALDRRRARDATA